MPLSIPPRVVIADPAETETLHKEVARVLAEAKRDRFWKAVQDGKQPDVLATTGSNLPNLLGASDNVVRLVRP